MLTLYFAPGSSAMAPHIALHEVGATFESRPLSFHKKQNRDPAYLAINPEGKLPTLLIDGRPLTEVAAILFYLARRYPEAALLPAVISRRKPRWCHGCRSSPPPSTRRGGRASSDGGKCIGIAELKWAGGNEVLPVLDRRHPPVPTLLALRTSSHATPEAFPG